jgi:hypothetical protein
VDVRAARRVGRLIRAMGSRNGRIAGPALSGLIVAASIVMAGVVYWPGLNGPLILDDIVNLQLFRDLSENGRLTLWSVLAERGGILGGRPVSWASFYANWLLTDDDIWFLKLTNLGLHLCNGILAFMLARALFGLRAQDEGRGETIWLAGFTAAFWLLMPMQVSTVLYVIQRMALLSALFSMLGLLSYVHGRIRLNARLRGGHMLVLASLLLFWPLAALSKQNGALLVFVLLALELLALRPVLPTPRWPLRVVAICSVVVVVAGVVWLTVDPSRLTTAYQIRNFTLLERLLTQPRVLLDYALNATLIPGGTPFGLFHDDFPVSRSLFDPMSTMPVLVGVLALPIAAWRVRHGPAGLIGFGLVLFLVAHSLEAGPFPLEIYFEHRNYFPSLGLALALGGLLGVLGVRIARARAVAALAVLILCGHFVLTATRVVVWTSWDAIIEANAANHARSPRAQAGKAILHFQAGRLHEGLGLLRRVVDFGGPAYRPGAVMKALVGYCLAGADAPAQVYDELRALSAFGDTPYTVSALRWYRHVIEANECDGLQRRRVADLVAAHVAGTTGPGSFRGNWILHDEVSRLLAGAGRPSAARVHLRAAFELAPSSVRAEMMRRMRELAAREPAAGAVAPFDSAGIAAPSRESGPHPGSGRVEQRLRRASRRAHLA